MAVFTVVITKDARRRLRRIPRNTERTIISKIDDLAGDPFAPNSNVTALTAIDGFRLRIGDWRVLYTLLLLRNKQNQAVSGTKLK
ncbi:MAG: hypothetical protein OXQ31_04385, partial [Spirochaetaceae bacterium]|nr:hypothetical protein [Spirochaetaceae bacterium]